MTYPLPSVCERAILEQFLKAEAMALWAVRSAQAQDVPPVALQFLRRHEKEEAQHLKQFELLLGASSQGKTALPRMPSQWRILAVQLYGYETLGLEFARLLVGLRPGLASILKDEEAHVDSDRRPRHRAPLALPGREGGRAVPLHEDPGDVPVPQADAPPRPRHLRVMGGPGAEAR